MKPATPTTKPRLDIKRFSPLIGLALFVAALVVLHRSAGSFRIHDVEEFVDALPFNRVWAALALVGVNFLLFTGYDLLALHYIGKRLPLRRVAATAMLGFSFSNVVGGMVFGGGGIRYRSYEKENLSALEILQISLFIWMSWIVGVAATAGVAACAFPHLSDVLPWIHLPDLRWFGIPLCLAVAGYLVATLRGRGTLSLRGMKWPLPPFRLALGQIGVVGADLILSAFILYLLIPDEAAVAFPRFAAIFVLALTLALFSGIPGGLGVFEVLMLHLLKGVMPPSDILGSLVVFRIIYYLIPLVIGTIVLGANEARRWLRPLKPGGELAGSWASQMIPQIFSLAVLLAGIAMLVSGTLPVIPARMQWLRHAFPLGVFEMSHFMASVVGLLLILFSRELQRKQRGAYVAVLVLLALGILFEAVKGHTLFATLLFGGLFLALLPCRKSFTRHSTLLSESFTPQWMLTVLVVIGAAWWLVFFNYRHIDYANELWWRFSFSGNASRAMRATAGAMVLLLFFGLRKLLQPPSPEPHPPAESERPGLRSIIQSSASPTAALAFLGDKAVLFSADQKSFLMYSVANRVWVAMGDPVGDPADFPELVWTFREQSDRHGGRAVFYQVSEDYMSLYVDAGFSFFKLGEEAIIPLEGYTLEGPKRAKLHYAHRRMEKNEFSFEVLPRESVPAHLPRLKTISDAWMGEKAGKEKSFSLGRFDESYMREFPVAIVRNGSGEIVAFANLWPGDGHSEISIDLMRYLPGTPSGIMDYLFASLFLWARDQGYSAFNMGMAPLAGLDNHPLGPLWSRLGVWVFRSGEHFYNFQGLRQYKDKFDPQWRPRYLASLGGAQLSAELIGITSLISGGLRRSNRAHN